MQSKHHSLLQLPRRSTPERHVTRTEFRWPLVVLASLIVVQLAILSVISIIVFRPKQSLEQLNNVDAESAFHVPASQGASSLIPVGPTATPTVPPSPPPTVSVPAATPLPVPSPTPTPQNQALRIRGVEITQGIQVLNEPEDARCNPNPTHADYIFCNNSLPLVAGRHTLVRAYLGCNGPCPTADVAVQLRIFKDGQEMTHSTRQLPVQLLQQFDTLSLFEARTELDHSINFEFIPPPLWMVGDVTFELTAAPTVDAGRLPAAVSLSRTFAERKPLRVAYLPVQVGDAAPTDPTGAAYWLLRMFPVPAVEYERLPAPDVNWDGSLSKSELLSNLLYHYWFFAQSQPADHRPDQLFGWLPQSVYNGGASDPFWCPTCAGPHSSRVAFGGARPEQDIGGPRILVHEIAHNLGAQHAWSPTYQQDNSCFRAEGVDIRVDPTWPYAQTPHIQEFGIDLYSEPPVIYPPSHYDVMAYCAQPWISPHTYRKLFDSPFLQPDSAGEPLLASFEPQVQTTDNGTLLVSGLIFPNGTVAQPEVIKLEGDAFDTGAAFGEPLDLKMPPGDDYCLQIYATDGRQLAQHCFEAGFEDVETGQPTGPAPYFFTLSEFSPAEVGRVVISRQQVEQASVTASQTPPQVSFVYPAGGEVFSGEQTIRWDAFDADGDRLRFDLFYSADNGQRWLPLALRLREPQYTFFSGQLPPAEQVRFRVIASDGFHITLAESSGAVALRPLPANSVSLVGPATVQSGQPFEVAVVAHQVAEPGLFGVQFKLQFDPGLVQVNSVQPNPAFELVLSDAIQPDAGQLQFVATRQGQVENLTGEVTLATLQLTAGTQPGQLYLTLQEVAAGTREGVSTSISTVNSLSLTVVE